MCRDPWIVSVSVRDARSPWLGFTTSPILNSHSVHQKQFSIFRENQKRIQLGCCKHSFIWCNLNLINGMRHTWGSSKIMISSQLPTLRNLRRVRLSVLNLIKAFLQMQSTQLLGNINYNNKAQVPQEITVSSSAILYTSEVRPIEFNVSYSQIILCTVHYRIAA